MKHLNPLILLFIFIILILFALDFSSRLKEMEMQLQIDNFKKEQKIQELEKEIRILKQDVLVLEYGFVEE